MHNDHFDDFISFYHYSKITMIGVRNLSAELILFRE